MKSANFTKRFIVLTCIWLCMGFYLKAQLVYIPDANFRNYISGLDATAIIGDSLDPANATVLNQKYIQLQSWGITDLTGIENFTSLTRLECQEPGLTILPAIPSTVDTLWISSGNLTTLPNLPSGLLWLGCDNMPSFNTLPGLPVGLKHLGFPGTSVSNMPFSLPTTLEQLEIDFTPVTYIQSLPATLQLLRASNCSSLPDLPPLPAGLILLDIRYNSAIACLPILPNSLQQLSVSLSSVSCLPNIPNNGNFTCDIGNNVCAFPGSFASTNLNCFGNCDGTITPNLTGGPYNYFWSNGSTSSAVSNLCANTYILSVVDLSGCAFSSPGVVISQPSLLNLTGITTNVSCSGGSDGSVTLAASGGTAPYEYSLDGSAFQVSNVFTNLAAGLYAATVRDANNCMQLYSFLINQPAAITVSIPLNTGICSGDSTNVCPVVSGGTPPYTYLWSGGVTNASFCNYLTQVTNYTVVVTDMNGCTGTLNFTPASYPSPSFSGILNNVLTCNGIPVVVCMPATTGGTFPYSYLWSTGAITQCITTTAGTYSYTVFDYNGCKASSSLNINYTPGWTSVYLSNVALPTCGQCDGQAIVNVSGASPVASYAWFPSGITTSYNYSICDNTDSYVAITDTSGCVDTLSFSLSCHSVWPGDANNDGTANNVDLLAIGIGYGSTGDPRPGATINWQAETGLDWADSLASGTNFKHIDCNGDGIIASDDTVAILQNYGLSHPLRIAAPQTSITDPPLYFDVVIDTIGTSQQLSIPLELGTSALPMDSIYGIAFTINYDTSLVKADSVSLSFPYCWLGNYGTDAISISKNDPINGKLYAAITRITHADTSGYGEVARLTVVTTDNVSGRLMQPVYDTLSFTLSDVTAINFSEEIRPVAILNDSLIIEDLTGIDDVQLLSKMIFYPNPVADELKIILPDNIKLLNIEVIDITGRRVKHKSDEKGNIVRILLKESCNGMYDVRVVTDKGVVTKKISVMGN